MTTDELMALADSYANAHQLGHQLPYGGLKSIDAREALRTALEAVVEDARRQVTLTEGLGHARATVRVRIAVAVDKDGKWNCAGWKTDMSPAKYDEEAMGLAVDGVADGEARYWIEADAPLPHDATLLGAELLPAAA